MMTRMTLIAKFVYKKSPFNKIRGMGNFDSIPLTILYSAIYIFFQYILSETFI